MTNSTGSSCPKCGASIPEGAPQGLCPKCVRAEVEAFAENVNTARGLAEARKANEGRKTALAGAWLQLGPVIGFIASVAALMRAFNFSPARGTGDAAALSEGISTALLPCAIGSVFGLIGTVLLLVALFAREYRAKWFYWFMMIYSILLLTAFPVGTVVGIICLVHITKRKEEFLAEATGREQVS